MLTDSSLVQSYPLDPLKLRASLSFLSHPRLGWAILYTSDPTARFIGSIVAQMTRNRFRLFSNYKDALEFIRDLFSELPWAKAQPHLIQIFE